MGVLAAGGLAGLCRARPLLHCFRTFGISRQPRSVPPSRSPSTMGPANRLRRFCEFWLVIKFRPPSSCVARTWSACLKSRAASPPPATKSAIIPTPIRAWIFAQRDFIYRELAAAQEKILRHTGVTPRLFRAPYGVRWFGLKSAQERLGLLGRDVGHHWQRLEMAGVARRKVVPRPRSQWSYLLPARRTD